MSRVTFQADELYTGKAVYEKVNSSKRGVIRSHVIAVEFGAVATGDGDGIAVAATATAAATLSATGALVSGGVATFTTPRNVVLTATGDNSGVDFTITGTDEYGETLVETIAGPNNASVSTLKAFKTVTSIASDGATVTAITAGEANGLGFPYKMEDVGKVLMVSKNGLPLTGGTLAAGLSASVASTATTADVRGTFTPTAVPGGARFTALLVMDDTSTKEKVYGNAQYGG